MTKSSKITMLDSLPYIDIIDESYKTKVKNAIQNEIDTLNVSNLHSKIFDLLGPEIHHRFDSEYADYLNLYNKVGLSKGKRNLEDEFIIKYKKICPGIETDKYYKEDVETLAIVHSYLFHQEISLTHLLSKTIENQWIINEDYVDTIKKNIEEQSEMQHQQLNELNFYRKNIQNTENIIFNNLENQWKEVINKNLEKRL